jgi:hypothetical protein
MNKLSSTSQFFIKLGGYDPAAAAQCTTDETLRMEQRGSLVFVPTFIALLGMATSIWTVSHNIPLALVVGILWSWIVLKIDTALMYGTAPLFSLTGIGRIVFAITASCIVSECLVMVVFQDTIEEKEQAIVQSFVDHSIAHYDSLKSLEFEKVQKSKQFRDDAFGVFQNEIDGTGGSGYEGWDKIGDVKYQNYQNAAKAYSADSLLYLNRTKELDASRSSEINAYKSARAIDIAGKLKTLSEIENPYVHIAAWFLRLLLIMAELMPLFMKYQPSKTSDIYDKVVAMQARALLHDIELETKHNAEVASEKSKAIGKLAKIQADLQTDIKEMDLNETYVRQMSDRYDKYMRKFEPTQEDEPENSKIKNIRDRIESLWQKMMSRKAS